VRFEKYVKVNQLQSAFALTVNGNSMPITVSAVNAEQSPAGEWLANEALIVPGEPFENEAEIALTVRGNLQSYAGATVGEDLVYNLTIEKVELEVEETAVLLKDGSMQLTVTGSPARAAAGKDIEIRVEGDAISATGPQTLDANGKAQITLTGLSGGEATVWISMEDSQAQTQVVCVDPDSYEPALRLPEATTVVESEAFMNSSMEMVVIPEGCEAIESLAFANCSRLKYVILPATEGIAIASDAFSNSDPILLYRK